MCADAAIPAIDFTFQDAETARTRLLAAPEGVVDLKWKRKESWVFSVDGGSGQATLTWNDDVTLQAADAGQDPSTLATITFERKDVQQDEPVTVELQQADSPSFDDPIVRHPGTDRSSVVTGLPEGMHYFRIRALGENEDFGPWSDPVQVKVEYMDRKQLLLLVSLGGVVVLLTVGAVVIGHRRTRSAS